MVRCWNRARTVFQKEELDRERRYDDEKEEGRDVECLFGHL